MEIIIKEAGEGVTFCFWLNPHDMTTAKHLLFLAEFDHEAVQVSPQTVFAANLEGTGEVIHFLEILDAAEAN